MRNVVVVDGCRTATGKFGGSLSRIPAPVHGAECVKALVERTKIDVNLIDEVIIGTHFQAGTKANPARQCAIYAGLPETIPAFTPNKNCATALKAMQLAAQSIQVGDNDVVIAGGCETMSAIPYILPKARFGYRMGPGRLEDSMLHDGLVDPFMNYHMGITAENVAEMCNITREEMDRFSVESHRKAEKAWAEGKYDEDIVPITVKSKKGDYIFKEDETFRKNAQYENFEKLEPIFKKDGKVTAGNASPVNDGSAVVLMMSEETAVKLGYKPLARYIAAVSTALSPSIMGYAPVSAVKKLVKKTGIGLDKVGLIELNEAFAAQSVACIKDLGLDPSIVNVNGGAIALGHAVGCTGCRISLTLMREMKRRDVRFGISTLCIGGGQAMAALFELYK
ncbi:MAG: thiolase family protein [Clostridia bacterium]|nr:thiolase family protein [Clostridia bacterium]MCI2015938.1 thiolase family protein [Clostridia bacterium]